MKKLFALILTVCLLATMSVTAFAANRPVGETEISFNVDPTYTVTIPATVELNKVDTEGVVTYENDYTLTAQAGVRLKKGEYIEVTVLSDFEMTTTEGATLDYTITAGGNAVINDGVVAEFDTDKSEQTATIHIAAADPDYAGEYKDTVTFTISVQQAAPAIINFTIGGDPYQAEEGMTWAEWVVSDYNSGDFKVDGTDVPVYGPEYMVVCRPDATNAWSDLIDSATEIESGLAYTLLELRG